MSSTTGQSQNRSYIRVSEQRKTELRWPESSIEHPKRTQGGSAAAVVRVHTYVCIQARPISTNPGSMEENLMSGTSLHAVSRWSRSPGCRGYISCFSFRFLNFKRTRPTASMRQPLESLTSLVVYTRTHG